MQAKTTRTGLALAAALALTAGVATAGDKAADGKGVAHGRYLVKVMGCNDCHTPGYGPGAGKVPEKDWLVGDSLGWQGPWGTTFASNLRLYFAAISEDDWVAAARQRELRPPMPWFTLRDVKESDLRAMYRFIRSLGPAGRKAPDYLPPGQVHAGPVVTFPAPPK